MEDTGITRIIDMIETKNIVVNNQELFLGLLILFFSLPLSVMFPFIALILGIVFGVMFLVKGIYAYRYNADTAIRTIAINSIAIGVMLILVAILTLFSIVGYITTTVSIEKYPGR